MTLKPWIHGDQELVADMRIFRVHRMQARSPRTGVDRTFSVLESGDWVNVVALTPEDRVILVRQFRHGTSMFTLEIPGGIVDDGEEPAHAAARELSEETGYVGDEPVPLGVVTPNPAILNNYCHTFLIENCRRVRDPHQDQGEDIEVELQPLADIPDTILSGGIHHALVICAFWWLSQHRPDRFRPAPATDQEAS